MPAKRSASTPEPTDPPSSPSFPLPPPRRLFPVPAPALPCPSSPEEPSAGPAPAALPLRLDGPADLLAAIPYLLGFHPADSLVVVGVRGSQVVFTMRLDLPDTAAGPLAPLLDYLHAVLSRQRLTSAMLVGFGDDAHAAPVLTAAAGMLVRHGIPVSEVLRATAGRYWPCPLPPDPTPPAAAGATPLVTRLPAPEEGLPYRVDTSPVAVAATVAGMVALPDRSGLADRIAPLGGPAAARMRRATRRALTRWRAVRSSSVNDADADARLLTGGLAAVHLAVRRYRTAGTPGAEPPPLADDEVAWLGLVLRMTRVRDEAWALADTGRHDTHLALWSDVVRRIRPRDAAPPAALLAFTAWQDGDGAFAGAALDRALTADPRYPMALLLARALAGGLPPSAWHPLSTGELAHLDTTACDATRRGA